MLGKKGGTRKEQSKDGNDHNILNSVLNFCGRISEVPKPCVHIVQSETSRPQSFLLEESIGIDLRQIRLLLESHDRTLPTTDQPILQLILWGLSSALPPLMPFARPVPFLQ